MNQKNKIVLTSFLICFSLLLVSFSAMAAIQLGTETITFTQPISIGTPTLSAHATTKSYVDSIVSKWKELQTVSPGSGTEWVKVATLGASTDSEVAVRITGGRDYGRAVNVEHWLMVSKRTDVIGIDYWANGDYSNAFDEIDIYVYRDTSTTPDTAYVYVRKNPYNFPLIQIYGKHSATINLQDNAPAPTIEQYWHNKTNGPTTSHANGGLNIPRLKVSGDALVSGNLGIGNTAPGYKLDVSGTGRFTGALTGTTGAFSGTVSVATPTASNHATTKSYVDGLVTGASSKWTTSGTNTYLTATGNKVGIGTTSPGQKLDVSGNIRSSGEIISTSANAFRAISGNYGSIIRNDGSSTYLLLTASADQYGSWNTLRPFVVNNSTGSVNLGNGSLFVNHGGNVGVGNTSPAYKLTVKGTIGTPDMNNPYLVLDSSSAGGNAAEQSAQISLGEGGRGSASLHLAYTGDGYSYIGMGTLSGNIPTYYAMKLYYTNNNVYFPGNIGIGQASPGYKLDVSGTGRFTGAVIVGAPSEATHAATKGYVDSAAGVSVTLRDVASGTTGNAVCTANSSVCLDVVVPAAPYPSLSYSCLWTNTGSTLKARCLK